MKECIECGNNISERAWMCPKCGCPIPVDMKDIRKDKENLSWKEKFLLQGLGIQIDVRDDFMWAYNEALKILTKRQKAVVDLYYAGGYSYAQIAEETGEKGDFVKVMHAKAIREIRNNDVRMAFILGKDAYELAVKAKLNKKTIGLISKLERLNEVIDEVLEAKEKRIEEWKVEEDVKKIFSDIGIHNIDTVLNFEIADFLTNMAQFISVAGELESKTVTEKMVSKSLNDPIESLELPNRVHIYLKRAGITTIGSLMELKRKDLMNIKNLGLKGIEAVIETQKKLKEMYKFI